MYELYKKVFGNIVLSNQIFYYFNEDGGNKLKAGDLPIGCPLKYVEINSFLILEYGESIPNGVEVIRLFVIMLPMAQNFTRFNYQVYHQLVYVIPPNITSISFFNLSNWSISKAQYNVISMPLNTIKKLKFAMEFNNQHLSILNVISLRIYPKCEKLEIMNHKLEISNDELQPSLIELTLNYNIEDFKDSIFPNTLKIFNISLN
ncbi:hypothetical protein ACTFIV_004162 [Dictyostelium citrinum]